jgi:hypothetical protein
MPISSRDPPSSIRLKRASQYLASSAGGDSRTTVGQAIRSATRYVGNARVLALSSARSQYGSMH